MTKLQNLQQALDSSAGRAAAPKEAKQPAPAAASYKAPSREGKANITAYLPPDFKAGLRLVQACRGGSIQDLIAEALNDLYTKYDVPTVRLD